MNIQERVIYLIGWVANIPQSSICPTTNLKDDLNLDSIDLMLLVVKMEKWFNIQLSNEDIEKIETVKDATECIQQYHLIA